MIVAIVTPNIKPSQLSGGLLYLGMSINLGRVTHKSEKDIEQQDLEIDVAKSTIEANKLNEDNAKFNKKHTKINTIVTVIAVLLSLLNLYLIISGVIPSE